MGHSNSIINWCDKYTITGFGRGYDLYGDEWVQRGLIDPCGCTNVEEGTELVLEPQGPIGVIPEPPDNGSGSSG
jgi:hypothetical protein